jgi:phenylpropionate dioxygenase-like ring-hydroxylating dioxygenase large terminal subunit
MIGIIPASHYYDDSILEIEQERIFSNNWHFVGFKADLSSHNDYVSCSIGGKSIVVQNFSGELHAFLNVCSHRFSEIRCEGKGNGPLRCPYHGWTYDASGIPVGIPSRPRFDGLTAGAIQALALQQYRVDTCGKLVFIALSPSVPSLHQWLGAAWERIEQMSLGLGELLDCNELSMNCNWKIAVENTLESYHVTFVHPKTFKSLGAVGTNFQFEEAHSSWTARVNDVFERQMHRLESVFGSRRFKTEGYLHQMIFPNLTIATTFGNSFSIQRITPQTSKKTRFTSFVFSADLPGGKNLSNQLRDMLNDSIVAFNRDVFQEDKVICEKVQRGVEFAKGTGQLSDEELRVLHFQQTYARLMGLPLHDDASNVREVAFGRMHS